MNPAKKEGRIKCSHC